MCNAVCVLCVCVDLYSTLPNGPITRLINGLCSYRNDFDRMWMPVFSARSTSSIDRRAWYTHTHTQHSTVCGRQTPHRLTSIASERRTHANAKQSQNKNNNRTETPVRADAEWFPSTHTENKLSVRRSPATERYSHVYTIMRCTHIQKIVNRIAFNAIDL